MYAAAHTDGPHVADVLRRIEASKIDDVLVVPLYPHHQPGLTGALTSRDEKFGDYRTTDKRDT